MSHRKAKAGRAARRSPKFPQAERVHAYARDVIDGKIVTGRLVRLACERHLRDMKEGPSRGLVWRPEMAESALTFFEDVLFLEPGVPFKLVEFQAFIVGSLYGWYGVDGFRRFHTAYIEIGKGNGKTPLAAGCGLYGLVIDDEHAPEIYSAAVTQDQASICLNRAQMMVDASPEVKKRVMKQVGSLTVPARYGVFRALSAEHKSLDGKIVHLGIVDELHEHPNDLVVDKLSAGTKQRLDALILEITNSGVGRTSVCWRHHETTVTILEQRAENDAWFGFVCGLDPCPKCHAAGKIQPDEKCPDCDDWRDEKVWAKANPGLDTILPRQYLRKEVGNARTMVAKENLTRRLNFCQWTEQVNRWISMVAWDQCAGPLKFAEMEKDLLGQPCKAAIDAATVNDIAAVVLQFRRVVDGEAFYPVLPYLFMPEANLQKRVASTGLRFDLWAKQGFLELTPGNQIDYGWIENRIKALADLYMIEEIAYDPWNITDMITRLQGKGFTCVPVRQGYATLSPPTKETEKDILAKRLQHGGHPVMRWMAGNVSTTQDPAGNIKPDKEKSTEKIDGIVGMIMARDRWLRAAPVVNGAPEVMFV